MVPTHLWRKVLCVCAFEEIRPNSPSQSFAPKSGQAKWPHSICRNLVCQVQCGCLLTPSIYSLEVMAEVQS